MWYKFGISYRSRGAVREAVVDTQQVAGGVYLYLHTTEPATRWQPQNNIWISLASKREWEALKTRIDASFPADEMNNTLTNFKHKRR